VIAMVKTLTLKITEEEHKKIKILSAEEGKSIKDFIMDLIRTYSQGKKDEEELEFEELDEEDLKDIDEGRKAYSEGRYKTFEQVKEELPCQ
jgi:uncharacterized protein (DUF1778 family)